MNTPEVLRSHESVVVIVEGLRARRGTLTSIVCALLAVAGVLATGCNSLGDRRGAGSSDSIDRVSAVPDVTSRPQCNGPEAELKIEWQESIEAAMERARREDKPLLIVFSGRRQASDLDGEF
jgi:hypothetical protein